MNEPLMDQVYLASEAIDELNRYRFSSADQIPPELREQLFNNFSAVVELHNELLPTVPNTDNEDSASQALFESILDSDYGDTEQHIIKRALTNLAVESDTENPKDDPALFRQIQSEESREVEQAQVELIERYGSFVKKTANDVYYKFPKNPTVDRDDLIQEGLDSLLEAANDYVPGGRASFLGFAGIGIYRRMTSYYANNGSTVRLPGNISKKLASVQRENSFRISNKMPVLDLFGVAEVADVRPDPSPNPVPKGRVTVGNIWLADMLTTYMGSIDGGYSSRAMGPRNRFVLNQLIGVDNVTNRNESNLPEDVGARSEMEEAIQRAIATLDDRDAEILKLRFGLEDGHPHTLKEIGDKFGIPGYKIKQIESRVLKAFRNPKSGQKARQNLVDLVNS